MKTKKLGCFFFTAFFATLLALARPGSSLACTRAVYFGLEGQTITGRSMDWGDDMHTNLWLFPRGMKRDGGLGSKSLRWTSKYGSVIASVYEGGTADGMNEQGLVANLLYLSESEFPPSNDSRPAIAVSVWAQYVLDNFASVEEAVAELEKETFRVVSVEGPGGVQGNVHMAISDSSGDSAIFEYLDGRLVSYHGREYQVMTNSPTYDQQLALNKYWEKIGGTVMLPGTNRAVDRFVRASFYINAARQSADPDEAAAVVFSVMRSVSVPRGISTPERPNISSTLWRAVADQKNKIYYFEDTARPNVLWVNLPQVDLSPGSGVRKLTLGDRSGMAGNQASNFKKAEPFKFLGSGG